MSREPKPEPPRDPPLELIVWRDIASHKGGSWSESPESGGTWIMYTAGWVTAQTKHDITIHSTRGDPAREPCYGHDTCIPVGCIVSRTVLRKSLPKID